MRPKALFAVTQGGPYFDRLLGGLVKRVEAVTLLFPKPWVVPEEPTKSL